MDNKFTKIELKHIKLFVKFLKKNNAYHAYVKNVSEKKCNYIDNIKHLINCGSPNNFLIYAFGWYNTEEGPIFWGNLNKKWERFISNFT